MHFKLSLWLCLFGIQLIAQSDPEAHKMLQKMSEKFNSSQAFEFQFEVISETAFTDVETYNGSFIQAGKNYHLSIPNYEVITAAADQYVIDHQLKEVLIQSYDWSNDQYELMSPQGILRIHENTDLEYAIFFDGEKNGRNITEIQFKPLDRHEAYSAIKLSLDSKKLEPIAAVMINRDGSRYEIVIKEIKSDISPADQAFVFDKKTFEGYFIEDLR